MGQGDRREDATLNEIKLNQSQSSSSSHQQADSCHTGTGQGAWVVVRRQFLCAKTHQNYKNKKVDCENLQVRPRPPSYSCGQGPGRVPGPGLRGSWPRPASGRIRADRSFLVARPGSHLELMAWPDGRLIAKAGAIFGAPVAICWCFFCDFLVLFLLR